MNVVAFGNLAKNTNDFTDKGSLIMVEGKINTRDYENQEGRKVYVTEVIAERIKFLDRKKEGNAKTGSYQQPPVDNVDNPPQTRVDEDPFANSGNIDISDDDLPF